MNRIKGKQCYYVCLVLQFVVFSVRVVYSSRPNRYTHVLSLNVLYMLILLHAKYWH
jgi:hypothetical protein